MGSDTREAALASLDAISIHAPRMGSDREYPPDGKVHRHFNPRSPHGERHALGVFMSYFTQFQSTLPAWGATNITDTSLATLNKISIHAPRMGSDYKLDFLL